MYDPGDFEVFLLNLSSGIPTTVNVQWFTIVKFTLVNYVVVSRNIYHVLPH